MKACLDVSYTADAGIAACLTFRDWLDDKPVSEYVERIDDVCPYIPGKFFLRELPCLLRALSLVADPVDLVVIDGYVWLGDIDRPGLGAHLFEALGGSTIVVGVAKTQFRGAPGYEVRRFETRPLYVSAAGVDCEIAARWIEQMHGRFRIPTLLKRVDSLSRTGSDPLKLSRVPAAP